MKKTFYLVCFLLSLFAFSCASSPENDALNEEKIEEPKAEQDSSETENLENQDENVSSEIESEDTSEPSLTPVEEDSLDSESDDLLQEEKVIEDELPEINEEENRAEDESSLPEEETDANVDENLDLETEDGENSSENENQTNEENQDLNDSNEIDDSENEQTEDISEIDSEDFEESDEDAAEQENENQSEENSSENEEIVPSRSMTVQKNQQIDIEYPGKGWIFQGTIDENGNVDVRNRYFVFGGRRLGGENTSFTLRARIPGKYYLHFYKSDVLSSSYIDDYLEVTVLDEESQSKNRVKAPDYKEVVPPKVRITSDSIKKESNSTDENSSQEENKTTEEKKNVSDSVENEKSSVIENTNSSELKTVIQEKDASSSAETNSSVLEEKNSDEKHTSSSNGEISTENETVENPAALLEDAKKAFSDKKYEDALSLVNDFLSSASSNIDEGVFLKAQILETKSKVQNIKEAARLYDLLIQTYPESNFWNKANERSIYLKRMYINIR